MRIDDDGIRLPGDLDDRVGVEIGGRRVWAFAPARDGRAAGDGMRLVPWPQLLVPYLRGRADVVARSLETEEVLFEDVVVFGDGTGVVELVDDQGRPLTVDKANHLTSMFGDASDEDRGALVDAVVTALEFMRSRGHDAFLAFGNLLGAVRDGRLIGHDNDADVAYLAKSSHPFDILLESLRIERELLDAGWRTSRLSGGTFKLWTTLPNGLPVGIDVFVAFYFQGLLHMMPSVAGPLPREALLPTSTVMLEGREVPAPARPEALLEVTYGSGWRVPDPSFKYQPPRWLRRRLSGYLRGERRGVRYWDVFYETKGPGLPAEPSSFARWVLSRDPRPRSVIDVGCGSGRDSVWLSQQGAEVLGVDYSAPAVNLASKRAREAGCPAEFSRLNLYDVRQMLTLGARLARERDTDAVYARLLLHTLEEDEGRRSLWRFSRSVLSRTRGRVYLEFPTGTAEDEFGEHFRRVVDRDEVRAELESYGFEIEHLEDHVGENPQEDPAGAHDSAPVCRMIARLKG